MKLFPILFFIFFLQINEILGISEITDKTVAFVNQQIILNSDIQNKINILKYDLDLNQEFLQKERLYHKILNQIITNTLIFQSIDQKNIKIDDNQINQMINDVSHYHNMTIDKFRTYLHSIGLDYKKYYSEISQEMIIKSICYHIVHQRLYIAPNDIREIIQKIDSIDLNKQFKLTHITINLPIQASFDQINISKNLTKLMMKKIENDDNIQNLMNEYYKNKIIPRVIVQKTKWIPWKDIPFIFDQYLKNARPGDIIGPFHSCDEIHILKINDVCSTQQTFPIIRVKLHSIFSKNISNNIDIMKQLLEMKKQIENNQTTFTMIVQENSKNFYSKNYDDSLGWIDLNLLDPIIQKSLLNLKKNQISMPIYTHKGWCLLKLIDINQLNQLQYIHERAYLHIFNQKFNEIINNWIQELKSKSYIKILQ